MKKLVPADALLIPAEATKVFTGIIYDVYQWPQTLFDGSQTSFEMLKRPDTVVVIGSVDDKLIVIQEEQPGTRREVGFPSGRIDKTDSSTLAAARRETLEETGYGFQNWRLINVYQPAQKIEWFVYVYLAWDGLKASDQQLDAGEKISIELHSFDEVKQLSKESMAGVGRSRELFESLPDITALLTVPEFIGNEVDR